MQQKRYPRPVPLAVAGAVLICLGSLVAASFDVDSPTVLTAVTLWMLGLPIGLGAIAAATWGKSNLCTRLVVLLLALISVGSYVAFVAVANSYSPRDRDMEFMLDGSWESENGSEFLKLKAGDLASHRISGTIKNSFEWWCTSERLFLYDDTTVTDATRVYSFKMDGDLLKLEKPLQRGGSSVFHRTPVSETVQQK